jgi:hypothetical protein
MEGIKITALSLERTMTRATVKLSIENGLKAPVTIKPSLASINGIMAYPLFRATCGGGETLEADMGFAQSFLSECGIESIREIEVCLEAVDDASGKAVGKPVMAKIKTDLGPGYEQAVDDGGMVLLEKDGVRVVAKRMAAGYYTKDLKVYVENASKKDISVLVRNASVSGVRTNPLFCCDLPAGKKAFDAIRFSGPELNNISDYSSMVLGFHVIDLASKKTIFDTEPLAVNYGFSEQPATTALPPASGGEPESAIGAPLEQLSK